MNAKSLSFGISPEARARLDSEGLATDYVPLIQPSVAPEVEVTWVQFSSDTRDLQLLQNDLGEELALEESTPISSLCDHVLHYTGESFVLLPNPGSTPMTTHGGRSAVTAGKVKLLREQTGQRMMDCKRALEATDGDLV